MASGDSAATTVAIGTGARSPGEQLPEPRKRGRPPDPALAERRRQEIVEAAYAVFSEQGYRSSTLDDVAKRAGIGKGTVYNYFESKRELLDHVLDFGVERLLALIGEEAPLEEAKTLEQLAEQLARVGRRMLELIDSERDLARLIVVEASSVDEALLVRLLGLVDTFGAVTVSYLAHGVRNGFLARDLDLEIAAQGLNGLFVIGLLSFVEGAATAAERARHVEALVSFAVDGMRANG